MRFAAEHLVTVSGFDVDADDPIDCLETVLKPAEWLGATALTVEPNTGEDVKHDYRASTTVATPHERGATIAEALHAEGMPVLEMFEVAAKRYLVEETDEGRTEAELIGPDEPFDPLLGLKLLSLRGRNDVVAAADYAPAEFPFDREAVHARARRHTRFELPGVRPEEVVVRVQLWLAATDLTTAVELTRKPLLDSEASFFEFLPAGEDPADGYHAALLFVVPCAEQLAPEERTSRAARHVAELFGVSTETARVEWFGTEPIGTVRRTSEAGTPSARGRLVESLYTRIGADPIGVVEDAVVPPEPDEEFELDLEELDDEEDGLTEEERAEFMEMLGQWMEVMGQVWLHFSLETNHPDSSAAEAAFVSLLEELEAGLSTEEVQYEIRSVEATDRGTHVVEAVCRTFEKDATKVLDDLMNSMPHGVWSSDTRPWDLGRKEHIILRWRSPGTAAHDSRGLVVHARKGPPEEYYKQIFQDTEDSEAEHEDTASESSS